MNHGLSNEALEIDHRNQGTARLVVWSVHVVVQGIRGIVTVPSLGFKVPGSGGIVVPIHTAPTLSTPTVEEAVFLIPPAAPLHRRYRNTKAWKHYSGCMIVL